VVTTRGVVSCSTRQSELCRLGRRAEGFACAAPARMVSIRYCFTPLPEGMSSRRLDGMYMMDVTRAADKRLLCSIAGRCRVAECVSTISQPCTNGGFSSIAMTQRSVDTGQNWDTCVWTARTLQYSGGWGCGQVCPPTHLAATASCSKHTSVTAVPRDYFGAQSQFTRCPQRWHDAEQRLTQRKMHAAGPPSATFPTWRRNRPFSKRAAHRVIILIVWLALAVPAPRPADASSTAGDRVIQARLQSVRATLQSSYLCTAVALPADPLKLVKVVPAAVGRAADMLLYGALRECAVSVDGH
jgi:hypothetical protein